MRIGPWQITRVEHAPELMPPVRRVVVRDSDPIAAVQEAACIYFGVALRDLVGPSRRARVVHARHVAMWVARKLTDASLPKIGRAFGGRDHTTVLHAVRKIDAGLSVPVPVLVGEVHAIQTEVEAALWRAGDGTSC